MTHGQIRNRLNQNLGSIWRMGDRDECSIKHVGYGLIAIAFDRPWTDAIDYRRPWDSSDERSVGDEKNLAMRWQKVVDLREKVGHKAWDLAVRGSDYGWYYEVRMEQAMDEYGISAADPTMAYSIERVQEMSERGRA